MPPAAAGGRALRFEPTRNAAASPYRYEIHPDDLYRLSVAADDADEVFWGIVHSHTHTQAVPVADGHRARVLPGRAVPPGLAQRGRGASDDRGAERPSVADRGGCTSTRSRWRSSTA